MLTETTLAAITEAAARLVRIRDIPAAVGLSDEAWQAALRGDLESVRLAVARGRAQALAKNGEDLALCSGRYGKAEVSLFILQENHGWPKPRRGRPPKSKLE